MKREILFRGKTKDGEWVFGHYLTEVGRGIDGCKDDTIHFIKDKFGTQIVDSETIGQFTGLTDKNGVKIFEGDIVFNKNRTFLTCKEDARTYLVKWVYGEYRKGSDGVTWLYQKPSFEFSKIQGSGLRYMSLVFSQEQIEIIGNIHDNPELLK